MNHELHHLETLVPENTSGEFVLLNGGEPGILGQIADAVDRSNTRQKGLRRVTSFFHTKARKVLVPTALAISLITTACNSSESISVPSSSPSPSDASPISLVSPAPESTQPVLSVQTPTAEATVATTTQPTVEVIPTSIPEPSPSSTPSPTPEPSPESTATPDKVEVSQITDRLPYELAAPPTIYKGKYLTIALGIQKELTDPNRACQNPANGQCPVVHNFEFNTQDFPDAQEKMEEAVLISLLNAYQQYYPDKYGGMTLDTLRQLLVEKKAPVLEIPLGYLDGRIATVTSSTNTDGLYFDPNHFPVILNAVASARNLFFSQGLSIGFRVVGLKNNPSPENPGSLIIEMDNESGYAVNTKADKYFPEGTMLVALQFLPDYPYVSGKAGDTRFGYFRNDHEFHDLGGEQIRNDLIPIRKGSGTTADWRGIIVSK